MIAKLKDGPEAWRKRSLADLDVVYVYLDAVALRVRSVGKVVGAPVLGAVAVLSNGRKHLLALQLCGGESFAAWKALTIWLRASCGHPCWRSSMGTLGSDALSAKSGHGRLCGAAVSTSFAILRGSRRPSRPRARPRGPRSLRTCSLQEFARVGAFIGRASRRYAAKGAARGQAAAGRSAVVPMARCSHHA